RPTAPKIDATEASLQQRLAAKRAELEAISGKYTSFHPDVIRIAREAQELETKLKDYQEAKTVDDASQSANQNTPEPSPLFGNNALAADFEEAEIQLELQRAERDIANRTGTVKDLSAQVQQLQARLSPPPQIGQELSQLMSSYEAVKQRYN